MIYPYDLPISEFFVELKAPSNRRNTSVQVCIVYSHPTITDNDCIPHFLWAAPAAAAPEARQVGVVHGGDKPPERDDDVQQLGGHGRPPRATATAHQVVFVAALAILQEHIPCLGGQCYCWNQHLKQNYKVRQQLMERVQLTQKWEFVHWKFACPTSWPKTCFISITKGAKTKTKKPFTWVAAAPCSRNYRK